MILAFIMAGCSINKPTKYDYVLTDEPIQLKRLPNDWTAPDLFRWTKVAFKKNNNTLRFFLSKEQQEIIAKYGQPKYLRSFKSDRNEKVYEWIYLNGEDKLFQFINRQVVFEGPVTDLENVLITYGYPRFAYSERYNKERAERITFIYESPYSMKKDTYAFIGGKLIIHKNVQ